MSKPSLTDKDGEVRELTVEDMKALRPVAEIDPRLPDAMAAIRNKGGRPRIEHPRTHIAFRWDRALVATIKATGKGYNARVEKVLREALAKSDL